MTTKIVLALLALASFTHASSWTDKDRERNYKLEMIEKGGDFDYTSINEQCEDEHPKCDVLKEYCNKHKIVRKKLCKNTCGECRASGPPDCSITKFGCCWDNKTIADGRNNLGCPECIDQYDECKYFKKHCQRHDIKLICPITCGIRCPRQCFDDPHQIDICPLYKEYGFCTVSPDLMQKICAKTCNFCPTHLQFDQYIGVHKLHMVGDRLSI